jgi:hypothetical protein
MAEMRLADTLGLAHGLGVAAFSPAHAPVAKLLVRWRSFLWSLSVASEQPRNLLGWEMWAMEDTRKCGRQTGRVIVEENVKLTQKKLASLLSEWERYSYQTRLIHDICKRTYPLKNA